MTKEEQAELEAKQAEAQAEAQDAEFEASIADLSEEDKEAKRAERQASSLEKGIDYEAELKKERERADKAEKVLADKRFKDAEKKRKKETGEIVEDDDSVSLIRQETERSLKQIREGQASILASQLAGSEAEKQLILAKWKNRQFPEGMELGEQINETYVLINGAKIISERNEMARGLKGKAGVNNDASISSHENFSVQEPKIAPDVKEVMVRQGFGFNKETKRYEKKLPSGSVLARDPKTGKIYQVGVPQAPIGA